MLRLFQHRSSCNVIIFNAFFLPFSLCYAQDINNHVINLEEGQWSNLQTVQVGGTDIKKAELSDSYCLSKLDSLFTVREYSNKVMNDIGQETKCDISNLKFTDDKILFQLICSAVASEFITKMAVEYEYNNEKIHMKGEGTVEGEGLSTLIKVDSLASRKGDCEEKTSVE